MKNQSIKIERISSFKFQSNLNKKTTGKSGGDPTTTTVGTNPTVTFLCLVK